MHDITGTLYQTDPAQMEAFLAAWLGETQRRDRLWGKRWHVKSGAMALHLETSDAQMAEFHLRVTLEASRQECAQWVERMTTALLAADILYLVGHEELDELAEPVGEAQTHAHPELERRYVPRSR